MTEMDLMFFEKDQITSAKSMMSIQEEQQIPTDQQDISFIIFGNNQEKPSLKNIISLKQLFSKCLPKMSKQHILNTILDKNHISLVMIRDKKQLVGATTFRIFESSEFVEIVFFAIKEKYQGIGFGTMLMSALKNEMQTIEIRNLLTYADNLARKFFHRQGFSENIKLRSNQYREHIKKYEGGTLMHCFIEDEIEESSSLDEQSQQKCFAIEQNSQKLKIIDKFSKSQKIQKVESRIRIVKRQKMDVEQQVQDENSLMKWLRKAEKMDCEESNDD